MCSILSAGKSLGPAHAPGQSISQGVETSRQGSLGAGGSLRLSVNHAMGDPAFPWGVLPSLQGWGAYPGKIPLLSSLTKGLCTILPSDELVLTIEQTLRLPQESEIKPDIGRNLL